MSDRARVIVGDCIEAMRGMEAASVDAVVTDPPYGLPGGFMGKEWDRFERHEDVAFGYYLAGLIDGEGCFRSHRHSRGSHSCAFSMNLRRDDRSILDRAARFLGHGSVVDTFGDADKARPMARWAVQDKEGCAALVGMLRRFPLRAKKRLDFEAWSEAVEEWLERPRGSRWSGAAVQDEAARLKAKIESMREYVDPPWSGNHFQDWTRQWAREALRVAKPGAHLVAFGGTRMFHRLTCGLEDAGWEIRDCIMWLYGSGFPKSRRVNQERAFCQCGEGRRNAEHTNHAPPTRARTGTENPLACDGPPHEDAPRLTDTTTGCSGGCLPDCGCDGVRPLCCAGVAQESAPSQGCVRGRSRSGAPADGSGYAQERTPCPAPHSDHRTTPDFHYHEDGIGGQTSTPGVRTSRADRSCTPRRTPNISEGSSCGKYAQGFPRCQVCGLPDASGWGSALKPAWEPIILARKPLDGTIAANVLAHGCGALNIEACRIPTNGEAPHGSGRGSPNSKFGQVRSSRGEHPNGGFSPASGRWPANVCHDGSEEVVEGFPRAGGSAPGSFQREKTSRGLRGGGFGQERADMRERTALEKPGYEDVGSAARFFYTAKASRSDRGDFNTHPTCKPTSLMRWLCRLVTPPGGLILDPFLGSGTTAVAAIEEGFRVIGIEREPEYVAIAERRIAAAEPPLLAT